MGTEAGWHAVALAGDIEPGTSAGTRLFGRELVVWRDAAGGSHVWEDRCPHRGMRLSFGFVRGSTLACLYHGWQYAADGRCRAIPAHPDLAPPDTIRALTFAARDSLGMIWANLDSADTRPLADRAIATHPARSIAIERPAETVRRHLLAGAGAGTTPEGAVTIRFGPGELICAAQACTADKSVLHIVTAGAGISRKEAVFWAEALRDALESSGEATP